MKVWDYVHDWMSIGAGAWQPGALGTRTGFNGIPHTGATNALESEMRILPIGWLAGRTQLGKTKPVR